MDGAALLAPRTHPDAIDVTDDVPVEGKAWSGGIAVVAVGSSGCAPGEPKAALRCDPVPASVLEAVRATDPDWPIIEIAMVKTPAFESAWVVEARSTECQLVLSAAC